MRVGRNLALYTLKQCCLETTLGGAIMFGEYWFRLVLVALAVAPPAVYLPPYLSLWLDGVQPLDEEQAVLAFGCCGGVENGFYCSSRYRDPCPSGWFKCDGWWTYSCLGASWWTCATAFTECCSCTDPSQRFRICIPASILPDSRCERNARGTIPCGNLTRDVCWWNPVLSACDCPAIRTPTDKPCPKSDCRQRF